MRLGAVVVALVAGFAPVSVSADPIKAAHEAAAMLNTAEHQLGAAQSERHRLAAIGRGIRGYEAALTASRAAMRDLDHAKTELAARIGAKRAQTSEMLALLQAIERTPAPLRVFSPDGPLATARAGLVMAELVPQLQAEAEELRRDYETLATLAAVQQDAAQHMERARDIQALADGLAIIPIDVLPQEMGAMQSLATKMRLPVNGRIIRRAGEADAAGIVRPGIIISTPPGALVTAPTEARVTYTGQFLDHGRVVILEPEPDFLVVLTGLARVFVENGEIVARDAPLGVMGGVNTEDEEFLIVSVDGDSAFINESLYVEVRTSGIVSDPLTWFASDEGTER